MGTRPRPGGKGNCHDQTRNLNLTENERAAGWSLAECIGCENGRRRRKATCELCGGKGLIKVFDGDTDTRGKGGRPPGKRKGRAA